MSDVLETVIYNLRNAVVRQYPYPHFYVDKVFPFDAYEKTLDWLDDPDTGETFRPLDGGYAHRTFTDELPSFLQPLNDKRMGQAVVNIFGNAFFERYPHSGRPNFTQEWRFIRDEEQYSIGPHTDTPRKVVSLLFYMPKSMKDFDMGTEVHVPSNGQDRRCAGGPHYPFDGFTEVFRAPYVPNSCFGFWKTDNSWHAVKPIPRKVRRDVLLFNIYEEKQAKPPVFLKP